MTGCGVNSVVRTEASVTNLQRGGLGLGPAALDLAEIIGVLEGIKAQAVHIMLHMKGGAS